MTAHGGNRAMHSLQSFMYTNTPNVPWQKSATKNVTQQCTSIAIIWLPKGQTNMNQDVDVSTSLCAPHMTPSIESNSLSIQVNVLFTQTLVVLFQCRQSTTYKFHSCNVSLLPISLLPFALLLLLTCRMGWSPSPPLAQQFSVSLQLALSLSNAKYKTSSNKVS